MVRGTPHGLESSIWKEHVVVFACQRFTWNMETWVDTSFSTDGQKSAKMGEFNWENNFLKHIEKQTFRCWNPLSFAHCLSRDDATEDSWG